MRYEKSLKEVLGEEEAKKYTRLALLGVAKNAPGYSADDLIQVAGLGLRELTPIEITKIQGYAVHLPFSTREIIIPKEFRGINFRGEVFDKKVRSDIYHLFKRTEIEEQWKTRISSEEYISDLHSLMKENDTKIVTYKFHNEWVLGFYTENRLEINHLGSKPEKYVFTICSTKWNAIISGYQVSGLHTLDIPEDAIWLK